MSKTKLFFILSILTFILIFSVAIVCGQCGTPVGDEQKIDVERQEQAETEEIEGTWRDNQEAQAEQPEGSQPPTVSLSIIMGPSLAEADDVCFYRVKAVTTGNPQPEIDWSKDDSNGAWGQDIAQVNLKEGQSYTLTATAVNSEGSTQDSITLEWNCDG
ncbi:MAG: hypothetical protein U5N58_11550 [Actinomycetota bacterium]|nr:hypothetical protein [Actinomycetota bacterium]